MKITAKKLQSFKKQGKKIVSLTAYDYSTAKFFDEIVDMILVGDSLAQVVLGYNSTLKIGMEEMKIFTGAVARGVKNAMVVADMPFLSYQASLKDAVYNAGELIKCGADAVKIEGGAKYIIETVKRLTESGIAVIGHLGFTPQFLSTIGGHYVMGKNTQGTIEILRQAKMLEEAGASAVVLEMVPKECARFISKNLEIPTIGIGAGALCDGQILVSDDILGKYEDFAPKFAKKYANLCENIKEAAKKYAEDVRGGIFPTDNESFLLSDEERENLENYKKNN